MLREGLVEVFLYETILRVIESVTGYLKGTLRFIVWVMSTSRIEASSSIYYLLYFSLIILFHSTFILDIVLIEDNNKLYIRLNKVVSLINNQSHSDLRLISVKFSDNVGLVFGYYVC